MMKKLLLSSSFVALSFSAFSASKTSWGSGEFKIGSYIATKLEVNNLGEIRSTAEKNLDGFLDKQVKNLAKNAVGKVDAKRLKVLIDGAKNEMKEEFDSTFDNFINIFESAMVVDSMNLWRISDKKTGETIGHYYFDCNSSEKTCTFNTLFFNDSKALDKSAKKFVETFESSPNNKGIKVCVSIPNKNNSEDSDIEAFIAGNVDLNNLKKVFKKSEGSSSESSIYCRK